MEKATGRFAPTPSGRMHLGNLYCALTAWLSARSKNGAFIIRIEDLDAGRCSFGENRQLIFDDLAWLGLDWDSGEDPALFQSNRTAVYEEWLHRLSGKAEIYSCYCSRAELHAASAPHLSDGQPIYDGKCYRAYCEGKTYSGGRSPAMRIHVPEKTISFIDGIAGEYSEYLPKDCGDFIVRRSDGVFAYQLAVVIDDALAGVTEVVRGADLLSSTARQIWLYHLLDFKAPAFYHIPLLTDRAGERLAKRSGALDVGSLRKNYRAEEIVGVLAWAAGQIDRPESVSASELLSCFDWSKLPKKGRNVQLPLKTS